MKLNKLYNTLSHALLILRYYEDCHFSQAIVAERMGICRQHVNYNIRRFEDYLGFSILERDARGRSTGFTPQGKKVMRKVRKINKIHDQIEEMRVNEKSQCEEG